jgi:cobalt-zinc-cadmium efflux system outer membrane protein
MSLPVFDRNQGNIAKAESEARQAREALAAARVALRAEITNAVAAFRAATAAVAADDPAQLEAARSVRDRLEASYEEGGRTILEVLDAEKAYRDALRFHIHAQSSFWHAFYALNAAVGTPVVHDGEMP